MITPQTPIGVTFDERTGEVHLSVGDALLPLTRDQLKDLKQTVLRAEQRYWQCQHSRDVLEALKRDNPQRRQTDFTPL